MIVRRIWPLWLLACLPLAVVVRAEEGVPPWPVEQTAASAYTAAYGEALNHFDEVAKAGGSAARQELSRKLTFYNQAIGRAAGVIDIAGKVYAGETGDAALSAGLLALGELAGTEAGKSLLVAAGIGTAPVTASIFAIQVGMASRKAVAESTIALELEILYGLIESDPVLKDRSRELGVGDPIPVTPESVEHAWRKIYLHGQWQSGFKAYVVNELGKDWPEQSYWDRLTLPAGNVEDQAALLGRKDEYKSYVAGLLGHLNNLARSREQFVVASRYLTQIKQSFDRLSGDSLFEKYLEALALRPKVVEFIAMASAELGKKQTTDALLVLATQAKRYAQDTVALLPVDGKLGAERQQLLADLQRIYDAAWLERNRQRRETVTAIINRAEEVVPAGSPAPTRFGGISGFETYQASAAEEFAKALTLQPFTPISAEPYNAAFRALSPAAETLARKETEETRAHYRRQVDAFLATAPAESEVRAYQRAIADLQSVDHGSIAVARDLAIEHVTTLYLQHYRGASLVVADSWKLEREVQAVKLEADKIKAITEGLCYGGRGMLALQGYVGLTTYSFPSIEQGTSPDVVASRYQGYLNGLERNISPYSTVSSCGGGNAMTGSSALASLPATAVALERAAEITRLIDDLQQRLDTLRAEVDTTKWYDERRLSGMQQNVAQTADLLREAFAGLRGAEGTRDEILAFIPSLETQLSNIQNDQEYLSRLRRIVSRIPRVVPGATDLYGQSVYVSDRTFMTRPGVDRACGSMIGSRPLMAASDMDAMWREFDRRLVDERLAWLSEHYNLGLVVYLRAQLGGRLRGVVPAGDYIFLGMADSCRYYEPAKLEQLATAIDAVPGDLSFSRNLTRADPAGDLAMVFGLARDERGEYARSEHDAPAAVTARTLAGDYWNALSRDSLRKLVAAYDAAMARQVDYLNKEADFVALQARIAPLHSAFSSASYEARVRYDRDINDSAVIDLYRTALTSGNSALGAYRGASTNASISASRQAQMARQADDIERELHFIEQIVRNLESQLRGRLDGEQARVRAEKVVAFYAQFKAAYERKDASRLMAMLSRDWKASDGTRPSDVEAYFRNMFSVFDEIRFDIGDVQVESEENGRVRVGYPLTIRGFIYSVDTEHEETSTITEVVSSPDQGGVRILETLQGRFWYRP